MSWVTIVWSMMASACLMLALIHALVWCSNRRAWSSLIYALAALAAAGCAAYFRKTDAGAEVLDAIRRLAT